jgi:peptide/nickel transport system substrate-binding protein
MSAKRFTITFLMILTAISLVLAACTPQATSTPAAAPTSESVTQPTTESMPAATQAPPTEAQPTPTQPAPAERKVATFIWTQEFDSLNPLYTSEWFSSVTQQLWLAWAWDYDENNDVHPRLVTEIPSEENGGISADGKTITLHLRDDIKWSDGTPITSDDFVFTYKMAIDPKNAVYTSYPYDQVQNIEASDPKTVVMTFEQPFAPWQATFWKGILPAHILQPVYDAEGTIDNADWNLKPTVGCGPYVFSEWESGSYARFVVNDNYWGEKPKIDEIFMRFVPDDASQVAALQANDGDLGTFIAYSDVPKLKDAGIQIITARSGYNEGWFFYLDPEKGNPGLLDVNVRKAIAMSVDREAINRDLLLGLTNVPASYWDALPFYNTPPLQNYPYDPEAAKALLDQAGWVDSNGDGVRDKDGKDLELTYGTTIREIRQDTQAVVQQQLAKVGIKVDLVSYDADVFFAGYADDGPAATGQVDIMEWSDSSSFPDPDYYYWLCSEIPSAENPSGANWQALCDEELDGLFKLETTQVDVNERQKTFAKINQIFYDKVYWLGLWQDPDVWAIGPRLQNVKLSGVTPFFNITEWDLQ